MFEHEIETPPVSLSELKSPLASDLDELNKKLTDQKLITEDEFLMVEGFIGRFSQNCVQIRKLYETGGSLGRIKFEQSGLPAHGWRHVENDLRMVAKILPAYLKGHKEKPYSLVEIEDLLMATLLHDIGWLKTEGNGDDIFKWSGEKFFCHCQDSAYRAQAVLQDKNFKGEADPVRTKRIIRMIKKTEFNLLPGEKTDWDDRSSELTDILRMADSLSYFCDPKHIPAQVQGLYKEMQAVARFECPRTWSYLFHHQDDIAQKLGFSTQELWQRFEAGQLTIGELKFPGDSVVEFVGSEYLPMNLDKFEPWLKFVDDWYGEELNEDRENYYLNVSRVRAIQALANISGEERESYSATVNPLCYLEGSLMGRDLMEVAAEKGLQPDIDWEAVDLKMLGVTEKNIFQRLVTKEIRDLLGAIPEEQREKRQEVFAALLTRFIKKHELKKRPEGKVRQDRFCLAVAPLAYKGILTAQEIFDAFKIVNAKAGENTPILDPVWTIRRDRDFEKGRDFKTYVERIKKAKVKKVVLAGEETEATLLEGYKDLISRLTEAEIEVTIVAGQIMQGERKDLGARNVSTALAIAAEEPLVQILGFQQGKEAVAANLEAAIKLGEEGRLMVSISSDTETEGLEDLIATVDDHPLKALSKMGIILIVCDPHDFIPTSLESEAVLAVLQPPVFQLPEGIKRDTKIGRNKVIKEYTDYYIKTADRLIRH